MRPRAYFSAGYYNSHLRVRYAPLIGLGAGAAVGVAAEKREARPPSRLRPDRERRPLLGVVLLAGELFAASDLTDGDEATDGPRSSATSCDAHRPPSRLWKSEVAVRSGGALASAAAIAEAASLPER